VQRNALADLVAPTVDEEECAFLGAQNTRPTTIEMSEEPVAEDDGVLRRDVIARVHCGLMHGCCSTPTLKSKRLASARCQKTRDIAKRGRWSSLAGKEKLQAVTERTLSRPQRRILVPKRDSWEARGSCHGGQPNTTTRTSIAPQEHARYSTI
jgi:hypothetical protein